MEDLLETKENILELTESRATTLLELEAWEEFVNELDDEQLQQVEDLLQTENEEREQVRDDLESYLEAINKSTENVIETIIEMAQADKSLQPQAKKLIDSITNPPLEEFEGDIQEGNFQSFIDTLQTLSITQLEMLKRVLKSEESAEIGEGERKAMERLIKEIQQSKHAYLVKNRQQVEKDTQTIEEILFLNHLAQKLEA